MATEPPEPADLKLYLAAHGHFYLVGATLVCRLPGLPEHEVDTGAARRAGLACCVQVGPGVGERAH